MTKSKAKNIIKKSGSKKATIKKATSKDEKDFVSIVVHELKAPLNLTKWNIELLINKDAGKITSKQKKLLEQINRGNERLLALVGDLLDLSKLQDSKFSVHTKPMQLNLVISDAIDSFAIQASSKKIKIKRSGLKGVYPMVRGDQNRVIQVLVNLLSNAIKYSPNKGSISINVSRLSCLELKKINTNIKTSQIKHTKNKLGYLVISVKDSGRGISVIDQKKLFSRFFRSDEVLDSEIEGTGLGLYITKTIIDLHGGDMWFKSVLGRGSTFYFTLPIK